MTQLFICIWPDLSFTFVQAESEDEALYQLDQLGPAHPIMVHRWNDDFMVDFTWDLSASEGHAAHAVGVPAGCVGTEMYDRIIQTSLPNLHQYFEAVSEGRVKPSAQAATEALEKDREAYQERLDSEIPDGRFATRDEVRDAMEDTFGDMDVGGDAASSQDS